MYFTLNGINHIKTTTYHQASNDEAENLVKQFKNFMNKNFNAVSIGFKYSKVYVNYNSCIRSTIGVSPDRLHSGRELRREKKQYNDKETFLKEIENKHLK